jgi:hypothetical protein
MHRGERRLLGGERRGLALRRTADGRLRPASEEADIADIWADQKRIQLKDKMLEQKRRELKKQRRRERGFFGLKQPVQPTGQPGAQNHPQDIEIRLSLPKLRLPPRERIAAAGRAVADKARANTRVVLVVAGIAVLVLGVLSIKAFGGPDSKQAATGKGAGGKTAVLSNQSEAPEFDTLLPVGKTIEELGGWGRVSPPDRDPVFAYSDTLADSHIVVSQQPMPNDYANDPKAGAAKIAKQFNAGKQLTTTEGGVVYIASANSGAQSVITTKKNLLIMIRSTAAIGDEIWRSYVYGLE